MFSVKKQRIERKKGSFGVGKEIIIIIIIIIKRGWKSRVKNIHYKTLAVKKNSTLKEKLFTSTLF